MTSSSSTVAPGVNVADAKKLLHKHRIEKLLVRRDGRLVGLITIKTSCRPIGIDGGQRRQRRLRVGAAIDRPGSPRAHRALVAAGVDFSSWTRRTATPRA